MAVENISQIEHWPQILKNCTGGPKSWKLESRITVYNSQTHVKVLYKPDEPRKPVSAFCSECPSYELVTRPKACILILDLDYSDKLHQYEHFLKNEHKLVSYLRSHPQTLYWETTITNGIHIVMCIDGPELLINESNMIAVNDKRCEFKKTCLVAPSKNYKSECGDVPLVCLSNNQASMFFGEITQLFFSTSYDLASYVNISGFGKNVQAAAAGFSTEPVTSDGRFDEFLDSQYMSTQNFQDDNDAASVVVDLASPVKKRKKRGGKEEIQQQQAQQAKRQKTATTARSKKGSKDAFMDLCEQRLKKRFDDEDDIDEASAEAQDPLNPVDALYLKLMERIADNAQDTCFSLNIARDITFALFETLRPFMLFIKKQENQREIELFPVNVQIFLDILLCSDEYIKRDPHDRFYRARVTNASDFPNLSPAEFNNLRCSFSHDFLSIFSRLGSNPHWHMWTGAYMRLLDKIQITNPGTGHLQNSKFDAYALYRRITKLNVQGGNMTEAEAEAEYRTKFVEKARNEIHMARSNWSLFFEFILVTLGSVHLNSVVVAQFKKFVDYSAHRTGEMTIFCNIFQDIKLQGIRFEMSHVLEEDDRCRSIPVAVINFYKYPWVKTNTPWFHSLVAKCFSNMSTETIEEFIKFIGMCYRLHTLGPKRIDFCHWSNCLPFDNGILDFEIFFKTLDEFTRAEDTLAQNPKGSSGGGDSIISGESGSDNMFTLNDFSREHYKITSKDIPTTFSYESIRDYIRIVLLVRQNTGSGIESIERKSKNQKNVDETELNMYLKKLRETFRFKHNIFLEPEDFEKYRYFSVYRHYTPTDTVFKPIQKCFSPKEYMDTFFNTHLLSLDNSERYSPEFCAYMRSLLGTDAISGLMGPFQYTQLLVVMLTLAQGLLRTKLFQVSLNLVGPGSNGKSFFMSMLKKCLGDKMTNVQSKIMYGNTSETNQQAVGLEETFFVYDQDADYVELSEFKKGVADIEGIFKRKLFHGLDRNQLDYTTPIFCSNLPLRYRRPPGTDDKTYEYAFHRRLVVIPFYNTVGKSESNIIENNFNLLEKYYDDIRDGTIGADVSYEEYEINQENSENFCEETLFVKSGYNLKTRSALHNIQLGLFWYLVDVLHVFGLANLSASSNNYVTASLMSQRILGKANYYFLRVLLDHYHCLDTIESNIEVIARAEPVDLYEFFTEKSPKSFKPEMLDSICDTFRKCFGIHIVINTPMASSMRPTSLDDGYSGGGSGLCEGLLSGVYMAHGLVHKTKLTAEQTERFAKQPYRKFNSHDPPNAELKSIPIGRRFGFGPLTSKVNEVITALCRGTFVQSLTKPLLVSDWSNLSLATFFK